MGGQAGVRDTEELELIYQALEDIPELEVKRGDTVLLRPAHPTAPMLVTKRFDRTRLPDVLDHVRNLACVSTSTGVVPDIPTLHQMFKDPGNPPQERHLRILEHHCG